MRDLAQRVPGRGVKKSCTQFTGFAYPLVLTYGATNLDSRINTLQPTWIPNALLSVTNLLLCTLKMPLPTCRTIVNRGSIMHNLANAYDRAAFYHVDFSMATRSEYVCQLKPSECSVLHGYTACSTPAIIMQHQQLLCSKKFTRSNQDTSDFDWKPSYRAKL